MRVRDTNTGEVTPNDAWADKVMRRRSIAAFDWRAKKV
jgi:hypothetical protein